MLRPTLPHLFHWRLFRAALLALGVLASLSWTPALALADGTSAEETAESRASYRYVHMTAEEALAELDRRGVPYERVKRRVGGVVTPVRLTGKLHGVHVHSSLPEEKRATSAFEIMDARFALALDDFAALLARHDIVELVHFTMYRPNGQKPGTEHEHPPTAKKKAKRPGKRAKKPTKGKQTKKPKARKRRKKAPKPKLGKGKKGSKRHASARRKNGRKQKTKDKAGKKPKARKGRKKAPKKRAAKKTATKKKGARKSAKTTRPKKKSTRKNSKSAKSKKKGASAKKGGKKAGKKGGKKAPPEEKPVAYSPPGTRHPAGLAIDVGGFRKRDGRWLGIAQHFRGKIGKKTCGRGATPGKTPESRELWSIACESVELGMFTYVLTPNYDKAHFDHFHMEIRPKVKWHWVK